MHLEPFLRVQKINPDAVRGGPIGFWMMGHGMMNHDDSQQYHDAQIAPAEKNTGASKEN